jgi:hypothetical protein
MDERPSTIPDFPGSLDLREPVVLSDAIREWLETVKVPEQIKQEGREPGE